MPNFLRKFSSIIKTGPAGSASLEDMINADAILVLGEDVTNTAPMIALAIRQSINKQEELKAGHANIAAWNDQAVRCNTQLTSFGILSATALPTKLDTIAQKTFFADPDTLASLGFAIAQHICPDAPLCEMGEVGETSKTSAELLETSELMARVLMQAQRPVIISGPSLNSMLIIESAANIAWALTQKNIKAQLCFTQSEANSLGLILLGEKNLDDALYEAKAHNYDTCIITELDISRRLSPQDFTSFLANIPEIIAMDSFEHMTTQQAHRTLPTPAFSETTGSLVNYEGRAQRYYKVFAPQAPIPDAWRTIGQLFRPEFKTLDEITRVMCETVPDLKAWGDHVYHANFRLEHQKIPRETREYSGRTAMNAHLSMHEQPVPSDPDTPLAHSMEGFVGQPPAALTPFFWAPGWNSIQALNKYQNPVGGKLYS